jgi:hypothetical protein
MRFLRSIRPGRVQSEEKARLFIEALAGLISVVSLLTPGIVESLRRRLPIIMLLFGRVDIWCASLAE